MEGGRELRQEALRPRDPRAASREAEALWTPRGPRAAFQPPILQPGSPPRQADHPPRATAPRASAKTRTRLVVRGAGACGGGLGVARAEEWGSRRGTGLGDGWGSESGVPSIPGGGNRHEPMGSTCLRRSTGSVCRTRRPRVKESTGALPATLTHRLHRSLTREVGAACSALGQRGCPASSTHPPIPGGPASHCSAHSTGPPILECDSSLAGRRPRLPLPALLLTDGPGSALEPPRAGASAPPREATPPPASHWTQQLPFPRPTGLMGGSTHAARACVVCARGHGSARCTASV